MSTLPFAFPQAQRWRWVGGSSLSPRWASSREHVGPGAFPASGGQAAVSLPRASEHIIVPPGARGAAEVVVNHQRQGTGGAGAPSGTGACAG